MFCDCSGADSDGSDGKKLMSAELKVTDPTVTVEDLECSKNVENTGFSEKDKNSEGDGKLPNSDGNFTVVGDRKIEIYTASLRDILKQSEARLKIKVAEEKGVAALKFRLAQ